MMFAETLGHPVTQNLSFLNPYRHGFVRVAVAVPRIRVADPEFNATWCPPSP